MITWKLLLSVLIFLVFSMLSKKGIFPITPETEKLSAAHIQRTQDAMRTVMIEWKNDLILAPVRGAVSLRCERSWRFWLNYQAIVAEFARLQSRNCHVTSSGNNAPLQVFMAAQCESVNVQMIVKSFEVIILHNWTETFIFFNKYSWRVLFSLFFLLKRVKKKRNAGPLSEYVTELQQPELTQHARNVM